MCALSLLVVSEPQRSPWTNRNDSNHRGLFAAAKFLTHSPHSFVSQSLDHSSSRRFLIPVEGRKRSLETQCLDARSNPSVAETPVNTVAR